MKQNSQETEVLPSMMPVVLSLDAVNLTDDQFYRLCQANRDMPLERTAQGDLVIRPPVGGRSGNREARFISKVWAWNEQHQCGYVFSSSTIFKLPQGGDRSPDVSWVRGDRWDALSAEDQDGFPPICPDFVIELRSRTDPLKPLQAKMQEYLNSGLRLGWLINPQDQQVEIYRLGQDKDVRSLPTQLSGESVLPGLTLSVERFRE